MLPHPPDSPDIAPSNYIQGSFIARRETRPLQGLSVPLTPTFTVICNTVVGTITNPLFFLKTNLTNSDSGGSPSHLVINESWLYHLFRSITLNYQLVSTLLNKADILQKQTSNLMHGFNKNRLPDSGSFKT